MEKYDRKIPVEDWLAQFKSIARIKQLNERAMVENLISLLTTADFNEILENAENDYSWYNIEASMREIFRSYANTTNFEQIKSRKQEPGESVAEFGIALRTLDRKLRKKALR